MIITLDFTVGNDLVELTYPKAQRYSFYFKCDSHNVKRAAEYTLYKMSFPYTGVSKMSFLLFTFFFLTSVVTREGVCCGKGILTYRRRRKGSCYFTNQISCRSQQERLHYTIYIQYHAYAVRYVRTF